MESNYRRRGGEQDSKEPEIGEEMGEQELQSEWHMHESPGKAILKYVGK